MLWSSYVRSPTFRAALEPGLAQLGALAEVPAEGDLVVVTTIGDAGAYVSVETPSGIDVAVPPGTSFVGVLGTRRSGVNVQGRLPGRPVRKGDRLSLISAAGLIGLVESVPGYLGGAALPVRVEGFPSWQGRPANVGDAVTAGRPSAAGGLRPPRAVVAGTSAECGKTTCMQGLIRAARSDRDLKPVAAVKATGTGRLRDINRYRDAGAEHVRDFVDLGLCTTYNLPLPRFRQMLARLVDPPDGDATVLLELGGDLLEARVPDAAREFAALDVPIVLCVNDALGAMAGLQLLSAWGASRVEVASMHANPATLAQRLGLDNVVDLYDQVALNDLFARTCVPAGSMS